MDLTISRATVVNLRPLSTNALQLISSAMQMPFDLMRAQHAQAVLAGLMANSILESGDFENRVDALEHICLGPFARQT
jgi:hypothetical protein